MNIRLLVLPKTHNGANGRKFVTYRTRMLLTHKDNPEAGEVETWLDLKFGKNVARGDIDKITRRGTLEVKPENLSVPFSYKVDEVVDEETGEISKKYPCVWVHKIEKFTPSAVVIKQSAFVLDDESETSETEIDG